MVRKNTSEQVLINWRNIHILQSATKNQQNKKSSDIHIQLNRLHFMPAKSEEMPDRMQVRLLKATID